MNDLLERFEYWWQEHGQFCRSGGGDYEKTFAFRAWEAANKDLWGAETQRFLSDVTTAAGLLYYGKTDKDLAKRIASSAEKLRSETFMRSN